MVSSDLRAFDPAGKDIPYSEHEEYQEWIQAGRPTEGADTSNLFIRRDLTEFDTLDHRAVQEYESWVEAGRDPDEAPEGNPLVSSDLRAFDPAGKDFAEPDLGFGTGAEPVMVAPGGPAAADFGAGAGTGDDTVDYGGSTGTPVDLNDPNTFVGPVNPHTGLDDDTVDYGGGPVSVPAEPEGDDTVDYGSGPPADLSDDDLGVH